ncbi:MAG: hypothetical protein SFY56_13155 [Bacteroidota bacterium]|nr:hypothetical protein [Bacteroidota bacterium]
MFLIADITFSFYQHLSMPLDGDMAGGIIPSEDVKPILKDPFGISVIQKKAIYPNPNRFFAHWTFYKYFNYFPIYLQRVVNPIESVYLSCAIIKIIIQIALIFLLSIYINIDKKKLNKDLILIATIITPLFQTNGYRSYMGIIDESITYTFFYALPLTILLLYYLPFYKSWYNNTPFPKNKLLISGLIFLCVFLSFNCPLIPGITLVITVMFYINYFKQNYLMHEKKYFSNLFLCFFTFMSLLSLYSVYIGINNPIFSGNSMRIEERYSKILVGIYSTVTQKIGYPILLIIICLNISIIKKYIKDGFANKALVFFKYIGIFSLFYIFLLPFGGYKEYRPNILRYDTLMPVTIALIYIYGFSTYLLIKYFTGKRKNIYALLIIIASGIYTFADNPEFEKNKCEKLSLEKISLSSEKIVRLNTNCSILSWGKTTDSINSKLNSKLLRKWQITKVDKLYYQKY